MVKKFHHRANGLLTSLLMTPVLCWVWLAAKEPVMSVLSGAVPRHVFSGAWYSTPFDTVHAGFVMDQPTIGKWLLLFTIMTASSLPYTIVVAWLSNRRCTGAHLAYLVANGILCVFLLSMLSWPLLWTVQYISSMGWTPRRGFALNYALVGGWLVIGFCLWAARRPKYAVEQ